MDVDDWTRVLSIGKQLIDRWHEKRMEQIRYEKVSKALREM